MRFIALVALLCVIANASKINLGKGKGNKNTNKNTQNSQVVCTVVDTANCNGYAGDGCETDISTDLAHCGACGLACPGATVGTYSCSASSCVASACVPPFVLVSGECLDTRSNVNHCGLAQVDCAAAPAPNTVPTCVNGVCNFPCAAGFTECSGMCLDLQTNENNCGACGNACLNAGEDNVAADATCTAGVCSTVACAAGFGDCDGIQTSQPTPNGCETDVATTSNCGACGNECKLPGNIDGVCAAGTCASPTCFNGFGDCDGDYANGCETDLSSNVMYCGSCSTPCSPPNAVGACVSSGCTIASCNDGWTDVDGSVANGCEVYTPAKNSKGNKKGGKKGGKKGKLTAANF